MFSPMSQDDTIWYIMQTDNKVAALLDYVPEAWFSMCAICQKIQKSHYATWKISSEIEEALFDALINS